MMCKAKPSSIEKPGLILGEGIDEVEFLGSLLDHLGLVDVDVFQYGGKGKLAAYLQDLPNRTGFSRLKRLCITRDVDHPDDSRYTPVASILQSIRGALQPRPVPAAVEQIVGGSGNLQIGIFLLPGQGRDGALEDICLEVIADDPAAGCLDEFFRCLDASLSPRPKLKTMLAKARVHAWLASREVADLARLGLATKGDYRYVDWDHRAFDPLKAFLWTLFQVALPANGGPAISPPDATTG
jgi:hypothetical protein